MLISNRYLIALYSAIIFFSCKDDDLVNGEPCNSYCNDLQEMQCIDGQCLCPEESFFTPFSYNDQLCHDLNESFYVRVGHEGNIDYFAPMDILKMPDSLSIHANSPTTSSKSFPEQFIVDWFTSLSDTLDYDKYQPIHIVLKFDNKNSSNFGFPICGNSDMDPYGYSPRDYLRPNDGVYYGIRFVWEIEFKEDSAILHVDVYSTGNGSVFLDDEITLYFERYRD